MEKARQALMEHHRVLMTVGSAVQSEFHNQQERCRCRRLYSHRSWSSLDDAAGGRASFSCWSSDLHAHLFDAGSGQKRKLHIAACVMRAWTARVA